MLIAKPKPNTVAPVTKRQSPSQSALLTAGWTNNQTPCSEPLTRLNVRPISISSTGIGLLVPASLNG